jgi:hypothetical protein
LPLAIAPSPDFRKSDDTPPAPLAVASLNWSSNEFDGAGRRTLAFTLRLTRRTLAGDLQPTRKSIE